MHTNKILILPPYGKRLAHVLARPACWAQFIGTSSNGKRLTIWLLTGQNAWKMAHDWAPRCRLFVLAPPGEDPTRFNWNALAGHPPLLLRPCGALEGAEVQALLMALVRDGVTRVLRLDTGTRYVAEEVDHAA